MLAAEGWEISRSSIQRVLKRMKFHPYRTRRTFELVITDLAQRATFGAWILNELRADEDVRDKLWMSDEAVFTTNGQVNSYNVRMWSIGNPDNFVQVSTTSTSVMVWAAMSRLHLIGPYFFAMPGENVNQERYRDMLENYFVPELHQLGIDPQSIWFQQDAATPHLANQTLEMLEATFGTVISGRNPSVERQPDHWPRRSPDGTKLDFFLWPYAKSLVYGRPHNSLGLLKQSILDCFQLIRDDKELLLRVDESFKTRVELWVRNEGRHINM